MELADLQRAQRQRVEQALENDLAHRDARWSEAIAVGSLAFVEKIKDELGSKAMHREVEQFGGRMCYAKRARSMASNPRGKRVSKPGKHCLLE